MLPLAAIQEVRRLLDEGGLSQRKIADRTGVSRGTVNAIARGRRGLYGSEPPPDMPTLCCWELPPERCTGCGGKVFKPCVLCRARDFRHRQRRLHELSVPRRVA